MTDIIYVKGDLVASSEAVIAHGCNAQGVMASGVAKAIRSAHPEAYAAYLDLYKHQGNTLHLGQTQPVKCKTRTVINLITQQYYGRDPNVRYVDYSAIYTAISNLNALIPFLGIDRIAIPMIGAGLGNGDWDLISDQFKHFAAFQPVVYVL